MTSERSLLAVDGLRVRFGEVTAVDRVSFHVDEGGLVGLIGPNGAGKSTALDALTGFVPASGRAYFDGKSLLDMPAHRRARSGLVRTWQSLELFDSLTVRENLQVAASKAGNRRSGGDALGVETVAEYFGLDHVLERLPAELSQGQQKMLGFARGLVNNPRMLLADEPAAGLDTAESKQLGAKLRRLRDDGLSILLIDHDMGLVLGVCDYIYVLESGKLIAEGTPEQIRADDRVLSSYLGESSRVATESGDQSGVRTAHAEVGRP